MPPQILILVRPELQDVKMAEVPKDGVVLLVNPSKSHEKRGFEPTYVMIDNPHPDWKGGASLWPCPTLNTDLTPKLIQPSCSLLLARSGFLFRSYPSSWALGVSSKRGIVIHGRQDTRPSLTEIDAGFDKVKNDNSVFSQAGAAAGLQRRAPVSD